MNGIFNNLDLLFVGIAVAATGIIAIAVFLENRKSATNVFFLIFSATSIGWSVVNFLSYAVPSPEIRLWLIRFVLFFAILQAFSFFLLMYVFPEAHLTLKKKTFAILGILVILTAVLTLSPFVFSAIETGSGVVAQPIIAPGIIIFVSMSVLLVIVGIVVMIKKTLSAAPQQKMQFRYLLLGVTAMFGLIIAFDLFFPVFLKNTEYIPLSALFILPFVLCTAYAILRHKLLGVKVIATESLTFILAVVTFAEIVFSDDLGIIIFRSGVFLLVLSFGILLIRSVRKEVEQRERLEKLTKALEAANEKLKEADRMKDEFLSFAAHDIKRPLTNIKQFSSLVLDGTYSKPEQIQATADKIRGTADRGLRLVEEFLDMRKIQEGQMEYNFEKTDIVALVRSVVDDSRSEAEKKGLKLNFTPPSPIQVDIDIMKIRQVIENLISNSIKYTEQGSIDVEVKEEEKSALISIKDTGLGLDPKLIPNLFEQFRREPGVAKKIQGTGLGLFIAKQFVTKHGGEIWPESDGPGKGSRFFARIPKAN